VVDGVVDGTGARLLERADAINALAAEWEQTVGRTETPPPVFAGEETVSWEEVEAFERAFMAALADESLAWPRRLVRAAELTEALAAWEGEAFEAHVAHAAAKADDRARHSGWGKPRLAWGERFLLRQWMALCAGLGGRRGRVGGRVFTWLRFALGGRMGPLFGNATFAAAEAVDAHALPDADGRLFTDWALERVRGGRYFGREQWGLDVLAGARMAVMSAAVAVWLAKGFAASEGRSFISREDAKRGVMLAERTFGHLGGMPFARFGGALKALESERGAERAVLAAILPKQ